MFKRRRALVELFLEIAEIFEEVATAFTLLRIFNHAHDLICTLNLNCMFLGDVGVNDSLHSLEHLVEFVRLEEAWITSSGKLSALADNNKVLVSSFEILCSFRGFFATVDEIKIFIFDGKLLGYALAAHLTFSR